MHTFVLFYWVTAWIICCWAEIHKESGSFWESVHLANEANEIDIIYIGAVQTEIGTPTLPSVYFFSVAMITPQN